MRQAPGQPLVQVFGRRDSRDTQKALRFFKERRVAVQYVAVASKPPSPTELRRFTERLGVGPLADAEGRRYRELGLGYMRMGDAELFERLLADPALLRLPLVRRGSEVAVGPDEAAWRTMATAVRASGGGPAS